MTLQQAIESGRQATIKWIEAELDERASDYAYGKASFKDVMCYAIQLRDQIDEAGGPVLQMEVDVEDNITFK